MVDFWRERMMRAHEPLRCLAAAQLTPPAVSREDFGIRDAVVARKPLTFRSLAGVSPFFDVLGPL